MVRNNTTLATLCFVIMLVMTITISVNADELDAEELYFGIDGNNTYTVEDGDWFPENAVFPPDADALGEDDLDAGTYTLLFPQGIDVTFAGSLTILEDDGAIGRIQATGAAGNMVTLEEAAGEADWGGVIILTDPQGGNLIEYCDISNCDGIAVQIGSDVGNGVDGQCIVRNSEIHNNGDNGIQVFSGAGGSDYSIHNNEIHDNGWTGIQIDDDFDGDNAELAVVNNIIYDNTGHGIQLHNSDEGIGVKNNIVYGNDASQIELWNAADNPLIHNNVLDGEDEDVTGLNVSLVWSNQIYNNIIVNCTVGIAYDQAGNPEVDFQLISNCDPLLQGCLDADEDIIEADPEFVDDANGDYHLLWESPAINTGFDGALDEFLDPDDSGNDIGAFGGPRADDFTDSDLADYCLITAQQVNVDAMILRDTYHQTGDFTVDDDDDLTVQKGTTISLDTDVEIRINGSASFNGTAQDPITLTALGANDWDRLYFYKADDPSEVKYVDIDGADTGLRIYKCGTGGDLTVSNVNISDCATRGIYIYDSIVDMDDVDVTTCGTYSVFVSTVSTGDMSMDDVNIHENDNTGLYLTGSDPEIISCEIWGNGDYGIDMHSNSLPDLSSPAGTWNDIFENDDDEIMLWSGSVPIISGNNIFHMDGGNPDGFMIVNKAQVACTAQGNWWGNDPPNAGYFSEDPGDIDWANWLGDEIDDIPEHELLLAEWDRGEYQAVYERCLNLMVDENSEEKDLIFAANYLLPAGSRSNAEFADMREALLDARDLFDGMDNAYIFDRFAIRCLVKQDRYQEAIAAWEAIQDEAKRNNDDYLALYAEISALELEIAYNDNGNLDSEADVEAALLEKQLQFDAVEEDNFNRRHILSLPDEFNLVSAHPNPFNSSTLLSYKLPEAVKVELSVFDMNGRKIVILDQGLKAAGAYDILWDAKDIASGHYLILLETPSNSWTTKATLIR